MITVNEPARTTIARTRVRRTRVAALFVLVTALAAGLGPLRTIPLSAGSPSSGASPASTAPSVDGPRSEQRGSRPGRASRTAALGLADGAVPEGTTVFDDGVPGVTKLEPPLLGALREAATSAEEAGLELGVDSGWRSAEYQEHLLRDAIAKYGSAAEAARWVATPGRSAHVSGNAADIGPARAAAWLSEHGARYGLCQIYRNEPWHYELRPDAVDHGCPPMFDDPTRDPRMRP
jgi:hypothetical protein